MRHFQGNVTANNSTGGIVCLTSSTITACYWSGVDGGAGYGDLTDSYKVGENNVT